MKTTIKTITDLAESLEFTIDRPAIECINVRKRASGGTVVVYTGQSTQEIYAWLMGFKQAQIIAGQQAHLEARKKIYGK